MLNIALTVFGLLIVQGLLTYFQINNYRNSVSEIRKQGNLFVGQVKGKLKAGSIVLMALDSSGNIINAKAMTGITVFNRFRSFPEIIGNNIYSNQQWLESIKNKQVVKAIRKGIEAMNNQMEDDETIDAINDDNN
ncbi:MAG: transcriptional regulator GutM [Eubacteriaceae bacterium]